jgi:hypothetical protein
VEIFLFTSVIPYNFSYKLHERNKIFDGKREGKRPRGRPKRRGEDNIRMDLKDVKWKDMDWMNLDQDTNSWQAVVNTVINFRAP